LRHRTVTYLVRKGGGEIRQIGSSCLRHYTGRDLARALRQAELLESARVVFEQWREDVYLGPVGARVKVQVEVQAVRAVGANRFGQVIWHGMSDRRGRWISWFASRGRRLDRGRRYELRGRVRRHGEWRGRPVTVLCRCTAEPI
jgi:hypothetical protein